MTKQKHFFNLFIFVNDPISLAHLYLGSNFHSSLQILSSSVRLDEGGVAAQLFSEMFNRDQVRDLAGPLKDIERLLEATPALSWLCA